MIPEYVIVHNGPVGDQSAGNYYVRYKDYIKNVASSEIYATWPDDTIRTQCSGYYVVYFEQGVYRMVPE